MIATRSATAQAAGADRAGLLDVVHDLALQILEEHTLDALLWLVAKSAIAKLGFEDCVIYLLDAGRGVLVQRAAFGPKSPEGEVIVDPIEIPLGQGIVGSVAETGRAELIEDVRSDPRYIVDDAARLSELAVPIVCRGQVIGVIDSEHSEAGFYSARDLEVLTIIASMASTKIDAALTIERLNVTVEQLESTRNALRREEARYRDLYNRHPSMFFSVGLDGRIRSVNAYACEQLGYRLDDLLGRSLDDVLGAGRDQPSVVAQLQYCSAVAPAVYRWESRARRGDGTEFWLRLTARYQGGDDSPTVLIVAEDVTETRALSQELEYNATHDWLTGLYNRREFERRVAEALHELPASGDVHTLCFVDLDLFKMVNDACGHAGGDALLRRIGEQLRSQARRADVVARLGGDEFGLLMHGCRAGDARRICEGLLANLASNPFHWQGQAFPVGASIGIVEVQADGTGLQELLSRADAACLAAKDRGRNCVQVYEDADADVARRRGETRWVARLTEALASDRFELWGQPIVALQPGITPAGHTEILLRLVDDDGRRVLPGAFISTAERYGFATRIDEWVVEHALQGLAALEPCGDELDHWAVNLSGASVGDPAFLERILARIQASGVDPRRLSFEITETAAVADLGVACDFIGRLQALGCRFAIDDFGSGLSSLAYLKVLPVDYLKIDGVFIKDFLDDPVSRAMVRAINDISQVTGKQTIAEFVGDTATAEALRQLGVHYAQGFGIARPAAMDALVERRDRARR